MQGRRAQGRSRAVSYLGLKHSSTSNTPVTLGERPNLSSPHLLGFGGTVRWWVHGALPAHNSSRYQTWPNYCQNLLVRQSLTSNLWPNCKSSKSLSIPWNCTKLIQIHLIYINLENHPGFCQLLTQKMFLPKILHMLEGSIIKNLSKCSI